MLINTELQILYINSEKSVFLKHVYIFYPCKSNLVKVDQNE